ncbi:MAG: ABC transporter permease [Firmicutes bacterium]|jgi:fluoroquinolone transport system permease protein|nr:ABC transporter permease [Bacillota bacterium]NLL88624.1 ABC transporter permease [Bacillota bacterium]
MNKLARLIKGEFNRLLKYKILPVSLVTAVIWIGLFLFISAEEAREIAPLVIFVDVAAMSILLLGASHHLEKQDGTIRTMMVMPVSMGQILTAKTIASMALALESAVVTAAALYIIHRVTFNYFLLLLFVVIAGAAHAAIGFILSLNSRDFTTMLGMLMLYMLVFVMPSIFLSLGIIDAKYEFLFMISPSHSASHLISSAVTGEYQFGMAVGGCIYLAVLAAVLLRFAVYPEFKDNAARG